MSSGRTGALGRGVRSTRNSKNEMQDSLGTRQMPRGRPHRETAAGVCWGSSLQPDCDQTSVFFKLIYNWC